MHKTARPLALVALLSIAVLASVSSALAGRRVLPAAPFVTTPLVDLIDIVIHNDEVIAIDPSRIGGTSRAQLIVGEDVLWVGARGSVVVTDRRVLGITTRWGGWQDVRLKVHEGTPRSVLLGDRVALIITDDRAIGLSSGGARFFEALIGTNERLVDGLVSENVAVLVTDRRVLGVSGFAPGIFATRVGVHEDFEFASTLPNFVTIGTDDRVLIFRATTAAWDAQRVSLY